MICRIPRTEGRSRRRQAGLRSRKKGSLLDETNCIPCRPTVPRQKLGAKLPTAPPGCRSKSSLTFARVCFCGSCGGLKKCGAD